jgi:glycerol-3-phosphate acyltransferase PlsY
MTDAFTRLLLVVLGYLLGSFPANYLTARFAAGVDLRTVANGNIGGMNTMRNVGFLPGLAGTLLDIAKGALAAYLGDRVVPGWGWISGALAVVGHNWMLPLKFAGGKGVATTAGMLLALDPRVILTWALVAAAVILVVRDSYAGAGTAYLTLPLVAWQFAGISEAFWGGLLVSGACLRKLRPDLRAFCSGRRVIF